MSQGFFVASAALACVVAAATLSAQGATQPPTRNARPPSSTTAFMKKAAEGGEAEIAMASTAESKTTNAQIKSLAETIHRDHETADAELKTIADRQDVPLPATPSKAEQRTADRLGKLNGAAFDRAYADAMVKDHQTDIREFEQHRNDSDPEVAAWVAKTLPVLQDHLQRAEAAQRALGGK